MGGLGLACRHQALVGLASQVKVRGGLVRVPVIPRYRVPPDRRSVSWRLLTGDPPPTKGPAIGRALSRENVKVMKREEH